MGELLSYRRLFCEEAPLLMRPFIDTWSTHDRLQRQWRDDADYCPTSAGSGTIEKDASASRSRNLVLRFMGGIGPRSSVGRDRKGEVSLRNVDNLQLKMANEE